MHAEHSQVVLTEDLPARNLNVGDIGVVIHVHADGAAYEVEFMTLEGETVCIETLEARQLRAVAHREIPHVRQLLAA